MWIWQKLPRMYLDLSDYGSKIELRRAIKERLSHVSAKQRETESRIILPHAGEIAHTNT